jgi:hypothetical protein
VSHDYVLKADILPRLARLKRVRIYDPPNGKAVEALRESGFNVASRNGDLVELRRIERK